MKRVLFTALAVCAFLMNAQAMIETTTPNASITSVTYSTLTVSKKMTLKERIIQKLIERKLSKTPDRKAVDKSDKNTYGLLSTIFGAAGFLFLIIASSGSAGFLGILSLLLAVAGLVLGILGIKRDKNSILGIIGTALSGVLLLLYIFAIILVASLL
jgi:hypothetical protein